MSVFIHASYTSRKKFLIASSVAGAVGLYAAELLYVELREAAAEPTVEEADREESGDVRRRNLTLPPVRKQ